jgi:CDP-glycerol glycerophosphotransferase
MAVGSQFGVRVLSSSFNYQGDMLHYGYPRNDRLIHNSDLEMYHIKDKLDIPIETKIVIYAPTFRKLSNDEKQSTYGIDLDQIAGTHNNSTYINWLCIVRTHSKSSGLAFISATADGILDVSKY